MAEKSAELAERLRQGFVGPLSEQETELLRDVQGFIEFAIRNGLSFPMIVTSIGRDFNDLLREGFDLSAAKSKGFSPKVAGYSKISAEDFGGEEEPLD
jgi:hypothetical protein